MRVGLVAPGCRAVRVPCLPPRGGLLSGQLGLVARSEEGPLLLVVGPCDDDAGTDRGMMIIQRPLDLAVEHQIRLHARASDLLGTVTRDPNGGAQMHRDRCPTDLHDPSDVDQVDPAAEASFELAAPESGEDFVCQHRNPPLGLLPLATYILDLI